MKIAALLLGLVVASAANASIAFFKYEIDDGGSTKICVYENLGNLSSITISSLKFCPLSLNM